MGSFFGGLLSARHDVLLIGRSEHIEAIRRHGLRITGKTAMIAHPRAATRMPRGERPELVLVSTKAYDTAGAMASLRPVAKAATFLTLQNGLDNPKIIAKTAARVIAGTTAHGVSFLGPGAIRHAGAGDTIVGKWHGVLDADVVRLRDILADAGVPTRISQDVRRELWAKVVVNAGINPIAALAAVPNGRLARDPRLAELVARVAREAVAAARSDGVALDADALVRRTLLVARRTATNRSSMLQDLDRGRRTEIDAITGAVVAVAERNGVEVPANRVLYGLVKAREEGRLEPGAG